MEYVRSRQFNALSCPVRGLTMRRTALICCWMVLGACDTQPAHPSNSLLGPDALPVSALVADSGSTVRLATRYPQRVESDSAFEFIGSSHGWGELLAVADVRACQIVLLDWAARTEVSRSGRCGDGPHEYRQPFLLSSYRDSLLVVDVVRHEVVLVAPGMVGERRIPLPLLSRHDISGIEAIGEADPDHLAIVVAWATGDPAIRRMTPLRFIISAASGVVVDSGLFAPAALATQRLEVPVRVAACFGRDEAGPWHAVQNPWMHEVLFFRGRDSLVWRHHDPAIAWIGTRFPKDPRGGAGSMAPSVHIPELACTDSHVLARYAEVDWDNEALPLVRGLIEVLPSTGSGSTREVVGAEGYDLFYSGTGGVSGAGGAAVDDTFMMRHMSGRTGVLLGAKVVRDVSP